jgi:glutamine amidotransferase
VKQITIIDYGSGNLHSIAKAFEKQSTAKGYKIIVSNNPSDLKQASHIVLPGVGAFADCINGLNAIKGMRDELEINVRQKYKPFLGVCVGMQMLADLGMENGIHKGLGWINGEVIKLSPTDKNLKIPHMGWNDLVIKNDHRVLKGIKSGDDVYFVHSYHFNCRNIKDVISVTNYGLPVVAAIAHENIIASQFHPEKSHSTGLRFISNFMEI